MASRRQAKELFTASEVARFCQVDLKTIHNWAERGEIRHFRTPGRHLRFRRGDVLDFLRRYGYPVPDVLVSGRPRVHVVDADTQALETTRRQLADAVETQAFTDLVDALISVGQETPDVLVIDPDGLAGLDVMHCVARLRSHDATRNTRIVVYSNASSHRELGLEAGVSAFIAKPDSDKLKQALDGLIGSSGHR